MQSTSGSVPSTFPASVPALKSCCKDARPMAPSCRPSGGHTFGCTRLRFCRRSPCRTPAAGARTGRHTVPARSSGHVRIKAGLRQRSCQIHAFLWVSQPLAGPGPGCVVGTQGRRPPASRWKSRWKGSPQAKLAGRLVEPSPGRRPGVTSRASSRRPSLWSSSSRPQASRGPQQRCS